MTITVALSIGKACVAAAKCVNKRLNIFEESLQQSGQTRSVFLFRLTRRYILPVVAGTGVWFGWVGMSILWYQWVNGWWIVPILHKVGGVPLIWGNYLFIYGVVPIECLLAWYTIYHTYPIIYVAARSLSSS